MAAAAVTEITNKSVVEHREENNVMNSMILAVEPSGERKIARTVHQILAEYYAEIYQDKVSAMHTYREQFFHSLCDICTGTPYQWKDEKTDHISDVSVEAKRVLAYYAPYLTLLGEKPMGISDTEARDLKYMLGFTATELYERTEEDHDDSLSKAYRGLTRRQHEMIEVIERAAELAQEHNLANSSFGEGREVAYRRIVKSIRDELAKSPIIKAEFSKTELEEFLIPAVAHRTVILSYE